MFLNAFLSDLFFRLHMPFIRSTIAAAETFSAAAAAAAAAAYLDFDSF